MLQPPLSSIAGWSWEVRPSRFAIGAGAPEGSFMALRGRGPSRRLRGPFSGTASHVHGGGDVHVFFGSPADVLALPSELRTRLRFGNVQVIVRFLSGGVPADTFPAAGIARGADLGGIEVEELTVALRFLQHPAIDSLAVLRELADVLPAELAPELDAWASALGAAEPALRVVAPSGRPLDERLMFTLGTRDFILEASHAGDLLAAAGVTRRELGTGSTLAWRRGGEPTSLQLATPDGGSGLDRITLTAETPYVTVSRADLWFAAQQAEGLSRTTRGNRVEPFINGPEYFDDLFTELQAISRATPPALYLAGFSIDHAAGLGPGTLAHRTLLDVARAIEAAGGEVRVLAPDYVQIDPSTVSDYQVAAVVALALLSIAGMAIAVAGNADDFDQINAFMAASAMLAAGVGVAGTLGDIVSGLEPGGDAVAALTFPSGASVAHFDPYPAELEDNWRGDTAAPPLSVVADVIRRFGVFHQRIAVVRNDRGVHAYCGSMDLSRALVDTREHGRRAPFHDVHARVDGPAVAELARTFIQRWDRVDAERPLSLAAAGSFDGLPADGGDIVQVARTYYRPDPASGRPGLRYAPAGESTILETTLRAIAQARRYIYIEDQCLTPPERYIAALEQAAAAERGVGALIIVVPDHPDQPFGLAPRQAFVERMLRAWTPDRLRIGTMRNPFSRLAATRTASLGRLILREAMSATAATVTVTPASRVPAAPFWLAIDREVMWVTGVASAADRVGRDDEGRAVTLAVERGPLTNLYGPDLATPPEEHEANAAATAIHYAGIFVHSKVTLIDDSFAAIGSANLDRRGFFSDGQCTLFSLREQLIHGENWIRTLRKRLWGELLGVPEAFALAMFDDPLAHLKLFDRPVYTGNRFVAFGAHPFGIDFGGLGAAFTTESNPFDVVISSLSLLAGLMLATTDAGAVFDTIIDPTSFLEPPP